MDSCIRLLCLIVLYKELTYCQGLDRDNVTSDGITFRNLRGEPVSDEIRLTNSLMSLYQTTGRQSRPVKNASDTINVTYSLSLKQILDLDELNQIIKVHMWIVQVWNDQLLIWDPEQFGGLRSVILPSSAIWLPDIVLYNQVSTPESLASETVVVSNNGDVYWTSSILYQSSCVLDMSNFPFDIQTCHFDFASWAYDAVQLDLHFFSGFEKFNVDYYVPSAEWQLLSHPATHNLRYYTEFEHPFVHLTYSITIKRYSDFYLFLLVIPSLLVACLGLAIFFIPPEGTERLGYGCAVLGSFGMLQFILVMLVPPTSSCGLALYFCANMILILFSVFTSFVLLHIFQYLEERPVPQILRKMTLGCIATLACAKTTRTPSESISKNTTSVETTKLTQSEEFANTGIPLKTVSEPEHGCLHENGELLRIERRKLEWKVIATVADRFLFVLHCIAECLILIFIFPHDF